MEKLSIPEYLNKDFLKCALETSLRCDDVEIIALRIEQTKGGGENYCSNIYHAQVKYNFEGSIKERSLIIKSLPIQKQGALRMLKIFTKETIFYLDIKPKLETLMWHSQTSWKLGARHIFSAIRPEQTIILADLSQLGFTMKSRQLGLSRDDAVVVIKKLAQYHALTMVMAKKEHKTIVEKFQHGLLNKTSINAPSFKALFGAQLLKLAEISSEWDDFRDISRKIFHYHDNLTEMIMKSVYPLLGSINVLNHGDLWVNNLLFAHVEEDRQIEVRFIDFQLCFYGSMAFDLHYFFNTSLQLEVLQYHKEYLITIYTEVLDETLKQLPYHIKPPSLATIKKELKAREGYGFFVAFGLLPLMAMDSLESRDNNLENFHDMAFVNKKIQLMFKENGRAINTLKFIIKELDIFK